MTPWIVVALLSLLAAATVGLAYRRLRRIVAASLIAEIAETMSWIEAHGIGADLPVSSAVYNSFHAAVPLLGVHRAREVASFYAAAALLHDHLLRGQDESHGPADKDVVLRKGAEALADLRAVLSPRRGLIRA